MFSMQCLQVAKGINNVAALRRINVAKKWREENAEISFSVFTLDSAQSFLNSSDTVISKESAIANTICSPTPFSPFSIR